MVFSEVLRKDEKAAQGGPRGGARRVHRSRGRTEAWLRGGAATGHNDDDPFPATQHPPPTPRSPPWTRVRPWFGLDREFPLPPSLSSLSPSPNQFPSSLFPLPALLSRTHYNYVHSGEGGGGGGGGRGRGEISTIYGPGLYLSFFAQ